MNNITLPLLSYANLMEREIRDTFVTFTTTNKSLTMMKSLKGCFKLKMHPHVVLISQTP